MLLVNKAIPELRENIKSLTPYISISQMSVFVLNGAACRMCSLKNGSVIHFVIDGGKLFFFVKDDPLGYALKPLTSNKTALRFTSRKLDIYLSKVITQKPPMRFFILDSGQKYEGKYPLYEINIHKSIQQLLKDAK